MQPYTMGVMMVLKYLSAQPYYFCMCVALSSTLNYVPIV